MKQVSAKIDLVQSMGRVTVIIFTIGVFTIAVVGLLDRLLILKARTENIKFEYIEKQKQIIKAQVESTVLFINAAKDSGVPGEDIIESVRKIKFGKFRDGYIFINTFDGIVILLDVQKELEEKNIWDLTDLNGVKVIQEERRAVRNPDGDFIYYSWNQPSTGLITPKVSFIKGIKEWEWMVGIGVYLNSMETDISIINKEIIQETWFTAIVLMIFLFLFLFLFQTIFKKYTKSVANEIQLFTSYFGDASINKEEIDISSIRFREFSTIAEDMNRMIKNKLEADALMYTSEQRIYMQREQSPLGYVEWDLDYKIIDWNPSSERIFGFSKTEILGKGFEFLISPEIIHNIKEVFNGLIDESGGTKNINNSITKDGRIITCEWYNKVLTDQGGKILSIVSLVDDITDRKLIDDQLQESLEEKKILLKEVHHRVKNNMAIISSFLSLQSMNIEDEYVRGLLQSSENRVRSMALIHENLYKSENLKDINVQIYIDELVATLLDSYGYGVTDISVKTKITQFDLDLDLLIPLGMLINEIISNALKHAFPNIDSPELSICLVKSKIGELVLTITDNGVGLPEKGEMRQDNSLGFMLINGLSQQIDSKMEIRRENGTEYKITIPV